MSKKEQIHFSFTQAEYNKAKKGIERRLLKVPTPNGDIFLFPLKKDEYIEYNETLVYQSIYGEQVANNFLANLGGMKELIKDCQTQSKKTNYITGIDGRKLYSRSPHSSLNLLLQGDAGIIAKKWMVNYHQIAWEKYKIFDPEHFKTQAFIHDEYDCLAKHAHVKSLANALVEGASKVTTDYNMNIPIAADAMTGLDWHSCH